MEQKYVVLLVDDEAVNLNALANILSRKYHVYLTTNPLKAVELAKINQPDIILLDIEMPELDGFELGKQLKTDPLTKHIPLIYTTASTDRESQNIAKEIGAVDILIKPIFVDQLFNVMDQYLP